MKSFTHYNARSIKEALGLLSKYNGRAKVNAGGTDLLDILKERAIPDYPDALINIKTIGDLNYIREDESGLRIGAVTKLAEITASSLIKEKYELLYQAAKSVATPLIRNMSTIGGNLAQDVRCWYYRYPHQLGGPIVCLRKGGKICNALAGDNRYHSIFGAATPDEYPCSTHCPAGTNIPGYLASIKAGNMDEAAYLLMKFNPMPAVTGRVCPTFYELHCNRRAFDDPVAVRCIERSIGDQLLEKNELITEIQISRLPEGARQGYKKFTLRKPVDFSIVSVASVITISNGQCKDARIALGVVGPSPFRSTAAEEILKGKPLNEVWAGQAAEAALAAAQPLAMNEYKIEIAKSLIKRVILGKE